MNEPADVEAMIRPLAMPIALADGYCSFPNGWQRLGQTSEETPGGPGRGSPGAHELWRRPRAGAHVHLVRDGCPLLLAGLDLVRFGAPRGGQLKIRWALHTTVRRSVAVHAAISLVIAGALVAIWLLSSHRYFWPIWPILGLVVVLAGHALLVPSASSSREQAWRNASTS